MIPGLRLRCRERVRVVHAGTGWIGLVRVWERRLRHAGVLPSTMRLNRNRMTLDIAAKKKLCGVDSTTPQQRAIVAAGWVEFVVTAVAL